MNEITIGKLLATVRANSGLSIRDVCNGFCNPGTYSRYETELNILNILGVEYNSLSDKAKRNAVYGNIEKYVYSQNMPFNRTVTKALNNYADFLMLDRDYDRCYKLSEKVKASLLKCSTQNMLYISLYHIACSLYAGRRCTKEQAIDYISLSIAIAEYFKESKVSADLIKRYLMSIFHEA